MSVRIFVLIVLTGMIGAGGCTETSGGGPTLRGAPAAVTTKKIDPQQVQGSLMSFAERYVVSIADVSDRGRMNATTPEGRGAVLRMRLLGGMGAMGNAVNPNPIVGLMDMAIMTTLTRESLEIPSLKQAIGPQNYELFAQTLTAQEADIWGIAGDYLSQGQIEELRAAAKRWQEAHPNQEFIGGARLADFPESKETKNAGRQIADSIFGLVRLDPFTGLDPAVRQVEESRILAERMFFYVQYMPMLLSWQTDLLYNQMIAQPEMSQLLKDTSLVSANTTGFTKASHDFAEACTEFAKTIENFRKELPEQQATLVKQVNDMLSQQLDATLKQTNKDVAALRDTTVQQLNDALATQRDATLKQSSAEIGVQRDAAIKQLSEAVTAQQSLLAKNTQAMMDSSIDRLYGRLRNLVLLAAGALFVVLVAFRVVSRYWLTGKVIERLPGEVAASKVRE